MHLDDYSSQLVTWLVVSSWFFFFFFLSLTGWWIDRLLVWRLDILRHGRFRSCNRIHWSRCLNDKLYYWEIKAQCCAAATVALCFICSPAPQMPSVYANKLRFPLALYVMNPLHICKSHPSWTLEQIVPQIITLGLGLLMLSLKTSALSVPKYPLTN